MCLFCVVICDLIFFVKQKTAYEMRISDWSSDVCSSDLGFSTFDRMLPMVRDGAVRETYWNYSITPIRGEGGAVAGVFYQVHETNERILYERNRDAEEARQRRHFQQQPGFITILLEDRKNTRLNSRQLLTYRVQNHT